jgi:general secretion pathway protein E
MDTIIALTGLGEGQVQRAHRLQAETGERLDVILVRLGLLSEPDRAAAYADATGVPIADLSSLPDAPLLRDRLRVASLRDARVLPLAIDESALTVVGLSFNPGL